MCWIIEVVVNVIVCIDLDNFAHDNGWLSTLETEEERVVRQVAESDITYTSETDVEVRVGQVQSSDEGFSVEYEPICFSDEERLVALQRLDQGAVQHIACRAHSF